MIRLTIENARIIDGTGSPGFLGGIAITDGQIAHLWHGERPPQLQAAETLDGSGLVLAPGFIDLHSHADFSIQGGPAAVTQLVQGVTTLLGGNCGATPFPTASSAAVAVEHSHLDAQFRGDWTDLEGYREATQDLRPGVNLGLQIGLSSMRAHVVGHEERPATAEEIRRMQEEIRDAAAQGARGFSSGLIYAPGSYSSRQEMEALVGAAAECGLLYSTHMRNESGELLVAVEEAISTAEAVGARLEISHLKAMGPENHGKPARALQLIDEARERGVDVTADVYPYTASSTTLTSRLPGWALSGGKTRLLERLADSDTRREIAVALRARFGRDVDPAGVVIASVDLALGAADYRPMLGRSLVEIGEADGCSPEEAALRVIAAHGAGVAIVNHAMAEDDVRDVLRHPFVSVASDGWTMTASGQGTPHPRSFGTFARVLGHYVRDEGVLTLEDAVRKMTSLPASRMGLDDRGLIAPGRVADVVLFDPQRIRDRSTYADPWQLAEGVEHVLLAGAFALRDAQVQPERHGRVL